VAKGRSALLRPPPVGLAAVTLGGQVRYAGDMPVVEGLARGAAGVVHVVNGMTFEHPEPR
jgi:hypothetical protein